VQKVFLADGADFAVTEEPGQTQWAEALLDQLSVVVGAAVLKQAVPQSLISGQTRVSLCRDNEG
jgi:hypothetical protein